MRPMQTLWAVAFSFGAVGCVSSVPPRELLDARAAYDRASQGPTAKINPAELHTAHDALTLAENSLQSHGDTEETRSLAYAAERQIQTAESHTREMQSTQQTDKLVAEINASAMAALGRANQQLATQQQRLQVESSRRQDAERRAAQAAADLVRVATVKEEPRGLVITLSGSVLFTSGKATLLPSAQAKLSEVANELTKQDPDSKIVVEGHTDSQGSDAFNRDLSQRRAENVREYLVSHGIAADRVTAKGFGPDRPVGDNNSPEGRANNRRVEIVIQPPSPGK